jgi:hypothetical protein
MLSKLYLFQITYHAHKQTRFAITSPTNMYRYDKGITVVFHGFCIGNGPPDVIVGPASCDKKCDKHLNLRQLRGERFSSYLTQQAYFLTELSQLTRQIHENLDGWSVMTI